MKTLYIDCGMGAAGDMLTAALLELVPDKQAFVEEFMKLGIPGVTFEAEASAKCGILGTHVTVKVNGEEEESHDHHHDHDHEHEHDHHHEHEHDHHHDHEHEHEHHHDHEHEHDHHHDHEHDHHHGHHHSSMHDIEHIVNGHLNVSSKVKEDVLAVYKLIAEAESVAHGVPVSEIHFHEVGTMDAVADITAVCMLMEKISPDKVVVSPIHVGSGQVKCAHGILPVPAPATAYILKDAPIYGGSIRGELCTPTGAALLKHFATKFGDMPVMKVSNIGYGMGKKDFEIANCVRVMLGESDIKSGTVCELCCNVDDMTGEQIGFAMEKLFEAGALDVYTTNIGMKKSRPGILISVMCKEDDREKMLKLIFRHTSTLGVRESFSGRYTMERSIDKVETVFGDVRVKRSSGYGETREKFEYEDLARIASENDMSISQVLNKIK